jgi:hypothetical protein
LVIIITPRVPFDEVLPSLVPVPLVKAEMMLFDLWSSSSSIKQQTRPRIPTNIPPAPAAGRKASKSHIRACRYSH